MRGPVRAFAAGVAIGVAAFLPPVATSASTAPARDAWSTEEMAAIASMVLDEATTAPADPSNAFAQRADAARLGRVLFEDVRLSANGAVACASCHLQARQFQDDRARGQGIGEGRRRTMPVMGAAHAPFLFWDGRKDSLWSQALGPLEDPAEHGSNRLQLALQVRDNHRQAYEQVFGPMPPLPDRVHHASPRGSASERAAWQALPEPSRDDINRVFANIGKAIAAFEHGIGYAPARFDRYARATIAGDRRGQQVLSRQEVRGLRVFLGKGQCATCHNGPLLSDYAFHNTGVPPADPARPDRGRADGAAALLHDEFNCLGRYSDAAPGRCDELRFLSTDDPAQLGAFRTPSLRNVATRPPYMHAGQFRDLHRVVQHYARSPTAALGTNELARPGPPGNQRRPIRLTARDADDLVAFLATLTGPVRLPALAPATPGTASP